MMSFPGSTDGASKSLAKTEDSSAAITSTTTMLYNVLESVFIH